MHDDDLLLFLQTQIFTFKPPFSSRMIVALPDAPKHSGIRLSSGFRLHALGLLTANGIRLKALWLLIASAARCTKAFWD
jgi:hypothetical protein